MKHSRKSTANTGHTGSAMGAQHPRHTHDRVNVAKGKRGGVTHVRNKPRPARSHGRKSR